MPSQHHAWCRSGPVLESRRVTLLWNRDNDEYDKELNERERRRSMLEALDEKTLLTQMNPPQPAPRSWMAQKIVPSDALRYLGAGQGRMLRVVATEGHVNDWA